MVISLKLFVLSSGSANTVEPDFRQSGVDICWKNVIGSSSDVSAKSGETISNRDESSSHSDDTLTWSLSHIIQSQKKQKKI
eukprot:m.30094 g.30094  ORF g.30094 m.30094 type:complete len:81 (-) comp9612_c0_seq1:56-298(-)